jgi:hypothetical protein
VTGWTVPDDALKLRQQPSREEMFSFYGRLELLLRGPAAFIAEVADYFWPQIRPAVTDPAVDGGAVALVGGKGSGKTTTVLAAVASGTPLISNDRLYVWPTSSQTTVLGWTDPIRVIGASPEAPKRMIPLIQHAHGDRNQVSEQPLPLAGSGTRASPACRRAERTALPTHLLAYPDAHLAATTLRAAGLHGWGWRGCGWHWGQV